MPFTLLKTEISGLTLGLWRIEEDEAYFRSRLNIYENEERILASISHPLKRLEWLSSRLCLKELLNIHHPVESLNHSNGKPYLSDGSFHISYSHSNRVSGAIASVNSRVSIDLEDLTKNRRTETRKLFMSEEEIRFYEDAGDPRFFYLFWSAKETLYKIHPEKGLVFKENLLLLPESAELQPKSSLRGIIRKDGAEKEYEIHYEFFPDVVLTYTADPVFVRETVG